MRPEGSDSSLQTMRCNIAEEVPHARNSAQRSEHIRLSKHQRLAGRSGQRQTSAMSLKFAARSSRHCSVPACGRSSRFGKMVADMVGQIEASSLSPHHSHCMIREPCCAGPRRSFHRACRQPAGAMWPGERLCHRDLPQLCSECRCRETCEACSAQFERFIQMSACTETCLSATASLDSVCSLCRDLQPRSWRETRPLFVEVPGRALAGGPWRAPGVKMPLAILLGSLLFWGRYRLQGDSTYVDPTAAGSCSGLLEAPRSDFIHDRPPRLLGLPCVRRGARCPTRSVNVSKSVDGSHVCRICHICFCR